jgi:valyl-tRNA synthetase
MNIPAGSKTNLLVQGANDVTAERLSCHSDLIKQLARVEGINAAADQTPKGAVQVIVDEATYFLPVGDVIDVSLETDRLTKEIAKAEKEIALVTKKLSNEKFTSRAPAEVVEENRERQAEYESIRDKLTEALARIKAL